MPDASILTVVDPGRLDVHGLGARVAAPPQEERR
jgi:hypothetical protein